MLSQISSNEYVKFKLFVYSIVNAKLYGISNFEVNIYNAKYFYRLSAVAHLPDAPVLSLCSTDEFLLFIKSSSSS